MNSAIRSRASRVQVARVQFAAGKRRLLPMSAAAIATRPTDDLGRFRVYNLPPGDYYVLALSGPFAGADDPSGFAPTYYPGTRVATQAQAVHRRRRAGCRGHFVRAGAGADGARSRARSWTRPDSRVPGATVMLLQTTGGDVRALIIARMAAEADGSFSFRNVAPGSYVIQAFGRPQGGGSLARAPFGSLALDVPDGGSSDLVIRTGASTGRGHISFEGTAPPPRPRSVPVFPRRPTSFRRRVGGGLPPTVTRDDWTFEVNNMNGRRRYIRSTSARRAGPQAGHARRQGHHGRAGRLPQRRRRRSRDHTDEQRRVDHRRGDGQRRARDGLRRGRVCRRHTKWTFPSRFIATGAPIQPADFA